MSDKTSFSSVFFKNNRQKLRKVCDPTKLFVIAGNGLAQRTRDDDAFPFQQSANFWYLSGVEEPDTVLVISATEEFIILPKRDSRFELFSGGFDEEKIKKISGVSAIYNYQEGWRRLKLLGEKPKQAGIIKPSPEYDRTYSVYTNPAPRRLANKLKTINKNLVLLDVRAAMAALRSIKSSQEIEAIKHAINHTAAAYSNIRQNFDDFKNEREIEAELVYYAAKHGFKQAFPAIVANGKNACTLHYHQNDARIDNSKMTLLDIGFSTSNYCADLTRIICPRPTKRQAEVHQAAVEIQNYALSLLKPGRLPQKYEKQVFGFAGDKLRELGLIKVTNRRSILKYFRHRTSHFLGIDVHDVGDYSQPLQPGMVLTVEPGIYIDEESIGVRLEDDILITKDGIENLSAGLSRDLN